MSVCVEDDHTGWESQLCVEDSLMCVGLCGVFMKWRASLLLLSSAMYRSFESLSAYKLFGSYFFVVLVNQSIIVKARYVVFIIYHEDGGANSEKLWK